MKRIDRLLAQERIGLVDEEQQAPVGFLRPIKQLMYLGYSLRSQRRNISARHQCVIEPLAIVQTIDQTQKETSAALI